MSSELDFILVGVVLLALIVGVGALYYKLMHKAGYRLVGFAAGRPVWVRKEYIEAPSIVIVREDFANKIFLCPRCRSRVEFYWDRCPSCGQELNELIMTENGRTPIAIVRIRREEEESSSELSSSERAPQGS